MSTGRVAKASDIVNEGQQVKVWIKELDRDKNRISLSMIAPGTMTLRDLEEGMVLPGRITRLERYGAFVDIGSARWHIMSRRWAAASKAWDVGR
jgi:small subunit ribosomal protein S1